jgi:hypothetical protein
MPGVGSWSSVAPTTERRWRPALDGSGQPLPEDAVVIAATGRRTCIVGIARYCGMGRSAYAHPMQDAQAAARPLIHCTPSTDPSFLTTVSRSYAAATEFLSGEEAVLVGTLVRLRTRYPMASIIPLSLARRDAPFVVWLVSREGWTEIEPLPSTSGPMADTSTVDRATRQDP